MNEQNNSNNSVAIVAIIVVGLLIAGAGFLYYKGNSGEPKVVEKETVIEKAVPQPAEEEAKKEEKEEPGFSFEYKNEDGESTKIEANGNEE